MPAKRRRTRLESSTRKTRIGEGCIAVAAQTAQRRRDTVSGQTGTHVRRRRRLVRRVRQWHRASGREVVLDDVADEIGVGLEVQLAQDTAAVCGDRLGADPEAGRNLLVALAPTEQTQHLVLPGGEIPV